MKPLQYWLLIAALCFAAQVLAEPCANKSPCAQETAEQAPPNNPLIGDWRYMENSGCAELYSYKADGGFTTTSGSESLEGHYTIESPAGGRYKVTRTITKDNHLADCSGSAADHTGETDVAYATFRRDNNALMVCPTAVSNECFGPLVRVKAQ